jgi:hypothetical protein
MDSHASTWHWRESGHQPHPRTPKVRCCPPHPSPTQHPGDPTACRPELRHCGPAPVPSAAAPAQLRASASQPASIAPCCRASHWRAPSQHKGGGRHNTLGTWPCLLHRMRVHQCDGPWRCVQGAATRRPGLASSAVLVVVVSARACEWGVGSRGGVLGGGAPAPQGPWQGPAAALVTPPAPPLG